MEREKADLLVCFGGGSGVWALERFLERERNRERGKHRERQSTDPPRGK